MIVAAQSEVLRQPVVIGKITAIVVTHRVRAIGCVHPVHLPSIPLTMDGLPGMRDLDAQVMQHVLDERHVAC